MPIYQEPLDTEQRKGSAGFLGVFRAKSSDALDAGPSQNILDKTQERTGLLSVFRNRSSDALEMPPQVQNNTEQHNNNGDTGGIGSGRSWLRHARKKSLSDGVQFMMSNRSLNASSSSSPPQSPTSSCRLSAAAAHQLHSADEGDSLLVESMLKAKASDESVDKPIHLRGDRRRLKKSISDNVQFMRAMNVNERYLSESLSWQHEKPPQLPNEGIVEKDNIIGQPLSNSGMDGVSERGLRPRLRTNSTESQTMSRIDESHSHPFESDKTSSESDKPFLIPKDDSKVEQVIIYLAFIQE